MGGGSQQCHQMTHGGVSGSTKMSRVMFCPFLTKFHPKKSWFFAKCKLLRHTGGGGGGQCHQMTHGEGRGPEISQKIVMYFFEWPLRV